MPIRSLSDVNAAFLNGRTHLQRFYKGANSVANVPPLWTDWANAAGQPAYDARIGNAGEFNPVVASGNDAIWFPDIPEGQHRHLNSILLRTQASTTGQTLTNGVLYDLLGVYPLIDGDSTDVQAFTTSSPIPRYSDGNGVFPVLVNHVAPMIANSGGTMVYTGADNQDYSVDFGVLLGAPGHVVSCPTNGGSSSANARGSLSMSLHSGCRGVKAIKSIEFLSAPGGLFSIYLVKPITTILNCDGNSSTDKIATEKFMAMQNGWNMPRIYDGAHLGFFLRANSGTFAGVFGHLEFIWG